MIDPRKATDISVKKMQLVRLSLYSILLYPPSSAASAASSSAKTSSENSSLKSALHITSQKNQYINQNQQPESLKVIIGLSETLKGPGNTN